MTETSKENVHHFFVYFFWLKERFSEEINGANISERGGFLICFIFFQKSQNI